MELLLKYNNKYYEIESCSIRDDLNSFWIADIILKIQDWFNQFDNIQIIEVDRLDKVVFNWFINSIEVEEKLKLTCNTNKALMSNKLVLIDKVYTDYTLTQIFNDLLSDWNTLTWDNLTFLCSDITQITKELKEWDAFSDILEELSWLLGLIWTVKDRQIIVIDIIWEERDYTAFYNIDEPFQTTINKVNSKIFNTQINLVIWSDWTTKNTKTDFTMLSEPIWIYESFRKWDLNNQTQELLNSRKTSQRILDIELQDNEWEELNIGDKINVVIEWLDEYRNYNWPAFINKSQIDYINWSKRFKLWVSNIYVWQDTFINKLNKINSSLKLSNL